MAASIPNPRHEAEGWPSKAMAGSEPSCAAEAKADKRNQSLGPISPLPPSCDQAILPPSPSTILTSQLPAEAPVAGPRVGAGSKLGVAGLWLHCPSGSGLLHGSEAFTHQSLLLAVVIVVADSAGLQLILSHASKHRPVTLLPCVGSTSPPQLTAPSWREGSFAGSQLGQGGGRVRLF